MDKNTNNELQYVCVLVEINILMLTRITIASTKNVPSSSKDEFTISFPTTSTES